uniref:Si:dkey-69o16.5 n=1 Tax=Oryzias melastigma TaxID=30732 RepID=A0A3B3BKF9_ORYME
MKRRLLLVSNSTLHGSGYLDHCQQQITDFFGKDVRRVLFVPYALHDRDAYTKTARNKFKTLGYEVDSIHEAADPVEAVRKAEGIFIGRRPVHGLQRRYQRGNHQHQHHQRHAHRLPADLCRHRPRSLQHQPSLPGPRLQQPPHGGDPRTEDHSVPRGSRHSECAGSERGLHAAGGGRQSHAAGKHKGSTFHQGEADSGVRSRQRPQLPPHRRTLTNHRAG